MEIRPLARDDRAALDRFVERVPEGDRTFFKEDVTDPDVVATWFGSAGTRFVAVDGGAVLGYVALSPLQGWSSHVGEIRVVVDADARGRGIGRALVRRAVLAALEAGLTKMMIEVVADQEPAIAMFRSLGFDPEALLKDHVRTRNGDLRDLMILAHAVEDSYAAMAAAGLDGGV
jgi:ribosomal protein S18 acetylase RimI-like enzyme